MTQQEIDALKARFKAGGYPTQQDFEALVDAIAAENAGSSSSSGSYEPTIIVLDEYSRAEIGQEDSTVLNAYCKVDISTIVEWWVDKAELSSTPSIVYVYNKQWYAPNQQEGDKLTVYINDNTEGSGNPDTIITALEIGAMVQYVYVDSESRWVPVDRGTTITYGALIDLYNENNA